MLEPGIKQIPIQISYFEGVNSLVSMNLGKKTEFVHMENARSKTIGTIEKREGQTVLGTNSAGKPFVTTANYSLFPFRQNNVDSIYRISVPENSTLSINVFESVFVFDVRKVVRTDVTNTSLLPLTIVVIDRVSITEKVNDNTGTLATIYYINENKRWIPLTGFGTNLPGGIFDYTFAEGCAFLVNPNMQNIQINSDGTTVLNSSSTTSHIYLTPPATKINYYKNRLYLADFTYAGVRYPTTIFRSSYPLGICCKLNEDISNPGQGHVATNGTVTLTGTGTAFTKTFKVGDSILVVGETVRTIASIVSDTVLTVSVAFSTTTAIADYSFFRAAIEVTSTTYLSLATGANVYDIYRGQLFISQITITAINDTSVEMTWTGSPSFLSSDDIWVAGTFSGKKLFRWAANPTMTGADVRQYDTFKLSGGNDDPITMLTNIGNIMITSNKSTMNTWNDYTLENFDLDIGCVSKKGYVKLMGTLFFLHYTGVYSTSGSTPLLVSNKIEKYITGATKAGKEACVAGKKGRSVFFTLGDVTMYKPDGSFDRILPDVCVEYNLTQENWYVHKNVRADNFATFVEATDSDRLEFTDTKGNHAVKEFLSGETDDGQEIDFRVDTMKLTLQPNYERTSNPIAIVTEVERGSAIQAFVNLENGEEYYPVEGTIVKGMSVVKITDKDASRGKPPIARLISISLRDSSKQLCKISRMSLLYTTTTDEIPNND